MTWCVLGDSATGTSHRARNSPCQDAFRYCIVGSPPEWLAIAVADGAGSAAHSEVGATLACDEFVRRLAELDSALPMAREAMVELFAAVRAALVEKAATRDVPPRELACTALLAIVGPTSAAFAQVGDGAIVLGGAAGYSTVFWPEPVEYVNATEFLTDESLEQSIRFAIVDEAIIELAVFTDGLQRLALDLAARTPHPGFFRPLFDTLRLAVDPASLALPFADFLDSPRVNDRTDDDKTLILAVRKP